MFIEEYYLFKEMSRDFTDEIFAYATEESHKKGVFLFKEGDSALFLYVLVEGGIRVRLGQKGYLSHVVIRPGEAFGWSSLLGRDAYTASAECTKATRVIKIDRKKLEQLFAENPTEGLIFFRRLARVIGQRLTNSYKLFLADNDAPGQASYG